MRSAGTQHTLKQKIKNFYHLLLAMQAAISAGFPARKLLVIGVTGTDGKTTTTSMIYHLLKKSGQKTALINTIQAYIGDEEIQTGLHVTTQDPRELQPLLQKILNRGFEVVVLETTSHGLQQHRVWGVDFDTAVITNVHEDHLDYHGTADEYLKAKAALFFSLAHSRDKGIPKTVVLNAGDRSYPLLSRAKAGTTWAYDTAQFTPKMEHQQALWSDKVLATADGISFDLCTISGQVSTSIPLIGSYNVENALAAACAALSSGCTLESIAAAFPSLPQIRGRMQKVPSDRPCTILVDFAHTPAALTRALTELRKITKGRLIVVFGCAGERDPGRRTMGKVAALLADVMIITNEDNRSEPVESIMAEIARCAADGGAKKGAVEKPQVNRTPTYYCLPDREEAIRFALHLAAAGDLVDITGKGHEQSLNVDGAELPWDDVSTVEKILTEADKA
ncbi:hypothetical protein AUK40_03555 [Candidatus Wirthbacteria bacterium CG2_30_54_11]|uniref:UDP-N-acetylmuramyl-tripeptide synthetase n=1 Tax=Candidatus Wirthbacteria bacterium CG2_30_54_11 TaxID=1817892 RepID=A0A1J5IYD8_9BACT|nr:MAG: hypothetical protein AUK40_03555 [Candidatus Wirthbacteria bacterium CG2_30_54_11]